MKCGVRFCGGCNSRYDRGKILKELQEERQNIDFINAEEGANYDFLLIIGGCSNCCASYEQFASKEGFVKIWDEEHKKKALDFIDNIDKKLTIK